MRCGRCGRIARFLDKGRPHGQGHMPVTFRSSPNIFGGTGFAERALRNIDSALPRQFDLMLAATITLPHLLASSEMSLPKSAGEPASTVPPRLASRALS